MGHLNIIGTHLDEHGDQPCCVSGFYACSNNELQFVTTVQRHWVTCQTASHPELLLDVLSVLKFLFGLCILPDELGLLDSKPASPYAIGGTIIPYIIGLGANPPVAGGYIPGLIMK